jgi:hypothetical protein
MPERISEPGGRCRARYGGGQNHPVPGAPRRPDNQSDCIPQGLATLTCVDGTRRRLLQIVPQQPRRDPGNRRPVLGQQIAEPTGAIEDQGPIPRWIKMPQKLDEAVVRILMVEPRYL